MTKRARGGAFGAKETNGKREGGTMIKMNPEAKVMKVGSKTSSDGFAAGGATGKKSGGQVDGDKATGNFAKRARGGAAFSSAGSTSDRNAKSDSGHEGE